MTRMQIQHGLTVLGLAVACVCLTGPAYGQLIPPGATADLAVIQRDLNTALEQAETDAVARWTNPATGHHGEITPLETFLADAVTPCRKYRRTWDDGNRTLIYEGAGCRNFDGTWRIVDERQVAHQAAQADGAWVPPDAETNVEPRPLSRGGIVEAQRLLAQLGYDPGPADGVAGPKTGRAVEAFQRKNEMDVTGELDSQVLAAMRRGVESEESSAADAAEVRDEGEEPVEAQDDEPISGIEEAEPEGADDAVDRSEAEDLLWADAETAETDGDPVIFEVQELLTVLAFDPGPINGRNNPRTKRAVQLFQRSQYDAATGIVDGALLESLRAAVVNAADEGLEAPADSMAADARDDASAAEAAADDDGTAEAMADDGAVETDQDDEDVADATDAAAAAETFEITPAVVKEVQERLTALGHDAGNADGVAGAKTHAAIESYQQARSLTVDGAISESLLRTLWEDDETASLVTNADAASDDSVEEHSPDDTTTVAVAEPDDAEPDAADSTRSQVAPAAPTPIADRVVASPAPKDGRVADPTGGAPAENVARPAPATEDSVEPITIAASRPKDPLALPVDIEILDATSQAAETLEGDGDAASDEEPLRIGELAIPPLPYGTIPVAAPITLPSRMSYLLVALGDVAKRGDGGDDIVLNNEEAMVARVAKAEADTLAFCALGAEDEGFHAAQATYDFIDRAQVRAKSVEAVSGAGAEQAVTDAACDVLIGLEASVLALFGDDMPNDAVVVSMTPRPSRSLAGGLYAMDVRGIRLRDSMYKVAGRVPFQPRPQMLDRDHSIVDIYDAKAEHDGAQFDLTFDRDRRLVALEVSWDLTSPESAQNIANALAEQYGDPVKKQDTDAQVTLYYASPPIPDQGAADAYAVFTVDGADRRVRVSLVDNIGMRRNDAAGRSYMATLDR